MLNRSFLESVLQTHQGSHACATLADIERFVSTILHTLFPEHASSRIQHIAEIEEAFLSIENQCRHILKCQSLNNNTCSDTTFSFMQKLENVYVELLADAQAMYEGDPAATSISEVIRSYPGFYAIALYRIAHALHTLQVEGLPRVITELGHRETGIDIHPAAQIGHAFCIDHGTGVVIGATTVIGKSVKLYQGVTLGALSVRKSEAHIKRHPTLEDNVVIYAGATILGGNTIIGAHSIIGGNTWITESVPPHSKIYYPQKLL